MADDVDIANERLDIEMERAIAARKASSCVFLESATHCHRCGAEIAPARRQALYGVKLCFECASAQEGRRA